MRNPFECRKIAVEFKAFGDKISAKDLERIYPTQAISGLYSNSPGVCVPEQAATPAASDIFDLYYARVNESHNDITKASKTCRRRPFLIQSITQLIRFDGFLCPANHGLRLGHDPMSFRTSSVKAVIDANHCEGSSIGSGHLFFGFSLRFLRLDNYIILGCTLGGYPLFESEQDYRSGFSPSR